MRPIFLPPGEMNADQQAIFDECAAGKRGRVTPPLKAWIHSPEMARHTQRLGQFLRYDTSLGQRLSELAILVTARHWTAHYEWYAHKKMALDAGLAPAIIDAIRDRRAPHFDDAKAQLVYDVSKALHENHVVPKPLYDTAIATLGKQAVIELIGLLGYYTLVSMTLNTFEFDLPDGETPELAP